MIASEIESSIILADPLINFDTMVDAIRGRTLVDYSGLETRLQNYRKLGKIILAARESGIAKHPDLSTLGCVFDDQTYCQKVIELLCGEIPLYELQVEEMFKEDTGEATLMIEPVGLNGWTDESSYELCMNPENSGRELSLTALLLLLNFGYDEEAWQPCIEYFGWPFEEPFYISYQNTTDEKYLRRYLKRKGAPPELFAAAKVGLFPPNNPYLNVYTEDFENLTFDFSGETIKYLRRMWSQSKKLLDGYDEAARLVENDPRLLLILGEGLQKSQKPKTNLTTKGTKIFEDNQSFTICDPEPIRRARHAKIFEVNQGFTISQVEIEEAL